MALHFSPQEFDRRRRALLAAMAAARLDGLLLFQQESMYWLTGYDSFGFCFFQCLAVAADGRMALLTRSADLRQARAHLHSRGRPRSGRTPPTRTPRSTSGRLHADLGLESKRLGVEFESYGLVHANGRKLEAAFDGFATLADASLIVTRLRAKKSDEEIAYVRRAAELADAADAAALALIRAGADEGDILAAQHAAIFRAGGDYPGNEFIIGSGRDALLCRYKSGRRTLRARSDHARIRGRLPALPRGDHAHRDRRRPAAAPSRIPPAAREALLACEAELRPGQHGGRCLCGPRARLRRARPVAAPAQRLRLLARGEVHAVLDGLADVLRGQSLGDRARHGVVSPT